MLLLSGCAICFFVGSFVLVLLFTNTLAYTRLHRNALPHTHTQQYQLLRLRFAMGLGAGGLVGEVKHVYCAYNPYGRHDKMMSLFRWVSVCMLD